MELAFKKENSWLYNDVHQIIQYNVRLERREGMEFQYL